MDHLTRAIIRSVVEERGLDRRGPKADELAALRSSPKAVDGAGRNKDERARTYFLHGVSVGVEGVTPFEHVERLRLIVGVRRVIKAGVLPCLAHSPVSARFGAGSLPGDVRAVRPHGQDHCIAIPRPTEDHSWPLLLHHPPFGASAREVNGSDARPNCRDALAASAGFR